MRWFISVPSLAHTTFSLRTLESPVASIALVPEMLQTHGVRCPGPWLAILPCDLVLGRPVVVLLGHHTMSDEHSENSIRHSTPQFLFLLGNSKLNGMV